MGRGLDLVLGFFILHALRRDEVCALNRTQNLGVEGTWGEKMVVTIHLPYPGLALPSFSRPGTGNGGEATNSRVRVGIVEMEVT